MSQNKFIINLLDVGVSDLNRYNISKTHDNLELEKQQFTITV